VTPGSGRDSVGAAAASLSPSSCNSLVSECFCVSSRGTRAFSTRVGSAFATFATFEGVSATPRAGAPGVVRGKNASRLPAAWFASTRTSLWSRATRSRVVVFARFAGRSGSVGSRTRVSPVSTPSTA
jgi:hypothetical protein